MHTEYTAKPIVLLIKIQKAVAKNRRKSENLEQIRLTNSTQIYKVRTLNE